MTIHVFKSNPWIQLYLSILSPLPYQCGIWVTISTEPLEEAVTLLITIDFLQFWGKLDVGEKKFNFNYSMHENSGAASNDQVPVLCVGDMISMEALVGYCCNSRHRTSCSLSTLPKNAFLRFHGDVVEWNTLEKCFFYELHYYSWENFYWKFIIEVGRRWTIEWKKFT